MKEQRFPGLNAGGEMTDSLLERISRLDHLTSLNLGTPRSGDDGLRISRACRGSAPHLAGCASPIAGSTSCATCVAQDRSLSGTSVTDAGVTNLPPAIIWNGGSRLDTAGDGAIRHSPASRAFSHFHAGQHVTAAGWRCSGTSRSSRPGRVATREWR